MLTDDAMIKLAETDYFRGCNAHDLETVLATMSDDCVMRFSAAKYTYVGGDAMRTHFKDFFSNFPSINFHNFISSVDIERQLIATHFTVSLVDNAGKPLDMHNCNFFRLNDDGLFEDVLIFNASPLKEGFEAGSQ